MLECPFPVPDDGSLSGDDWLLKMGYPYGCRLVVLWFDKDFSSAEMYDGISHLTGADVELYRAFVTRPEVKDFLDKHGFCVGTDKDKAKDAFVIDRKLCKVFVADKEYAFDLAKRTALGR